MVLGAAGARKNRRSLGKGTHDTEELEALLKSATYDRGVPGLMRKTPDGTFRYDPRGIRDALRGEWEELSLPDPEQYAERLRLHSESADSK